MAEFTAWKMIYPKELQDYVKQKGVSGVAEYVSSKLQAWKNVEIQLSVCGVAGSGKSSFIKKKKVLKHHILQVVFQNILTGPPKYFYATIRARRPILLLLQLFILMRLSRFILQSIMNNLLNNQGF